ncbi:uroporphyrinogen-III C-methyltransferase [Blastococcus sp. Marseille-P5729]|uniref:uroporphyrinogen-III C-methyltransferase n=1 Tax=Blastococcus sp. Marseille-P5729 TaxID=2086582 RepID=UPI000D0F5283|nr:uroporphyrinogen-III C-methyltransferase [Blastococcus sp. Marseille-P5729]
MSTALSVGGRSVLLHSPGAGVAERIHALLTDGARVTVLETDPDATLRDLASRGLVELVTQADPMLYDVVVRDQSRTAEPVVVAADPVDGSVTLVGGGPGDEGLLTIAGLQAIRNADVIVCDRLAPLGALREARPDAEVVHVGKIPRGEFTPQAAINEMLVERAKAGKRVVRFKGGDSFVFGRGGEEWNACVAAGVPVRSIPGISSSIAAAELVGIPVTHRAVTQGFIVVSGHVAPGDERNDVDWAALASSRLTIVVLMGVAALPQIAERLIAEGLCAQTPAACIADASMPSQRSVCGTLADIGQKASAAGISAPAVTIIGKVVTALAR